MGVEDNEEMKRRKHTPEQVVCKLREADRLLAEGSSVAVVIQHLEVTEATYYRWRNQFGGLKAEDANGSRNSSGRTPRSNGCSLMPNLRRQR